MESPAHYSEHLAADSSIEISEAGIGILSHTAAVIVYLLGIIDLVLYYVAPGKDGVIGIIEILLGIMISFLANYIKKFYRSSNPVTE